MKASLKALLPRTRFIHVKRQRGRAAKIPVPFALRGTHRLWEAFLAVEAVGLQRPGLRGSQRADL